MNWEIGVAAATLLIQLIGIVWFSGSFSQKIRENVEKVGVHDQYLAEHRIRLDGHDVQLAKMEAWREGYNAGSKKSGER